MAKWHIKHILTPPYHPASNGLGEQGVGIVKGKLKKMGVSGSPVDLCIALAYVGRVHGLTPHASTNRSPYEMMKKSAVPSLFQNLCPQQTTQAELTTIKSCAEKIKNRRAFQEDDEVNVYDSHRKLTYKGKILEVMGRNDFLVETKKETSMFLEMCCLIYQIL